MKYKIGDKVITLLEYNYKGVVVEINTLYDLVGVKFKETYDRINWYKTDQINKLKN